MNKERFEELSEALRQAKAVRRGGAAPSRVWSVTRNDNGQLHRRQLDPKDISADNGRSGKRPLRPRERGCDCRKTSLRNCSAFPSRRCITGNKDGASRRARQECCCAWPHGIPKSFWKKQWREWNDRQVNPDSSGRNSPRGVYEAARFYRGHTGCGVESIAWGGA